MAIIIGHHDSGDEDLNSMINTTPLVDVMLVLLIIFLITVPVVTHTVAVKLPNERNQPFKTRVADINLSITQDGKLFWAQQELPSTDVLFEKLKSVASIDPQPEVHIRGDQNVAYEHIGDVLQTAQRAGITKIGFVLKPTAPR